MALAAFAFRYRNSDRGRKTFPRSVVDVLCWFLAAIRDGRDVAKKHGLAVGQADRKRTGVIGGTQEIARLQDRFAIAVGEAARALASIAGPDRLHHLHGGERVCGQARVIEHHPQLTALPADQRHLRHVFHLLDRVEKLGGYLTQFIRAVSLTGKRERENRNVVDGARLDQRQRRAGRNQVEVGEHLLIQADDAGLFVLSHLKTDDRQRLSRAGSGVDVFDAGNFMQQFLHRLGDAFFHFPRRRAGHGDENIDHRHFDLRLFLARKLPHRKHARCERCQDDQRRQLGGDESVRDISRRTELAFRAHGRISSRAPSSRFAGAGATTRSPADNPESTSTWPLTRSPSVTIRARAV